VQDSATISRETLLSHTPLCRDYPESFVTMDARSLWATSRRRKVTVVPLLNGGTWVRRPDGEVG
jgi:hypothetical protein